MTASTLYPVEQLRGRLKWFLFFRVVLASLFLGALALALLRRGGQQYAVSIAVLQLSIAVTYALTILSAVLLLRLKRLLVFAYLQVAFDVALTTGVIFVTGGSDSPFGFLYSLVVINAAMLLSTPGAIVAASTSSIAYAALVLALNIGLVAHPAYPFQPDPIDLQFSVRFAITNVTFYLIAFLATLLVRRLHQTEALLEEREAERDRLASVQEALARHIGSALIITDAEGRVSSLNYVAEELAGARALKVIGKDIGAIFAPLRQTAIGRLQFLQSSGNVQPTEFQHRTDTGRQLSLRCSTVVLQDTYRNPIGALFVLQDITALRRLEQRLQSEEGNPAAGEEIAVGDEASTDGLIGTSTAICRVREFMDKAARSDATLLVTGESGTGKELVARAVHARSARRDRPFVAVNCGAIPANLIESELFGHVKGAFTGAVSDRAGLFRMADGGTIFLDEIGDLPLPLQVKLLRILQERTFTPVGADSHVTVDVRVIAATNRELSEEMRVNRFREDLFYRLNVLTLELPPLRERRQDIPSLVRRFLRQSSEFHEKRVERLSVAASRRLQAYDYPGNVRELENIIEHAVALCDGETVHEQHLPDYMLKPGARSECESPSVAMSPAAVPPVRVTPEIDNLEDNLAAYEKAILLRALGEAGGVKKRAAELLGINYRSFRHRLQKYGLGGLATSEQTQDAAG
ncbi:MAG: sigma-54 interaction domain-containing protein [Candidatus Binatia bacterium]